MVGRTLAEIRAHLESLAASEGPYSLVCARTGLQPHPVDGLRFLDRGTAAEAAETAAQYRSALRRYDARLPHHDLIVCEEPTSGACSWEFPPPTDGTGDAGMVDFCHRVAGAVFESLSATDRNAAEREVLEAYLLAAERTADRDRLCLTLLESMVETLESRFGPAAQLRILVDAAERLPQPSSGRRPIEVTLTRFRSLSLLDGFRVETTDTGTDPSSWTVHLDSYLPGQSRDRVLTLPLVLDFLRRQPGAAPAVRDAARVGADSWRFTLTVGGPPEGLLAAPASPE